MLNFNDLRAVWLNILSVFLNFFINLKIWKFYHLRNQLILFNQLLIPFRHRNNIILLHYVFFCYFLRFHNIFYNPSLIFNLMVYFSTLIEVFINLVLVNLQFFRIKRHLKYLLSINWLNHIQIIKWILANNNWLYHLVLIEILLVNEYWLILIKINRIFSIIENGLFIEIIGILLLSCPLSL